MKNLIELKEHEELRVCKLTVRDFQALMANYKDKLEVTELATGDYVLKAKQYVGRIVLSDSTLIIIPKIGETLFEFIFSVTYGIDPFREEITDYDRLKDTSIYEQIVKYFLREVERLCMKGITRMYYEVEENLPAVRGRVLIEKDLTANKVVHHLVYCRYDEFGPDIIHNQIIKFTLQRLAKTPMMNASLYAKVRHLIGYFEQVSSIHLSPNHFPALSYSRLNSHYKQIILTSRLILENSSLQMNAKGEVAFFSYLVNMEDLFDKFVASILIQRLVPKGYVVTGAGRKERYLVDIEGTRTITPDILIKKGSQVIFIVDSKYEPDIDNSDLYQIWTYCIAMNVKQGALVYPREGSRRGEHHSLVNNGVSALVTSIDINKFTIDDLKKECMSFADYLEARLP